MLLEKNSKKYLYKLNNRGNLEETWVTVKYLGFLHSIYNNKMDV